MRCRLSADVMQTKAEDWPLNMSCREKVRRRQDEHKMFSLHQVFFSDQTCFNVPSENFDEVEWTTGEPQSNLGILSMEEKT